MTNTLLMAGDFLVRQEHFSTTSLLVNTFWIAFFVTKLKKTFFSPYTIPLLAVQ